MTTQDIKQLGTHRMFGDGKVSAVIGSEYYLIDLTELIKMLDYVPLEVTKKRKYNYLIIKGTK